MNIEELQNQALTLIAIIAEQSNELVDLGRIAGEAEADYRKAHAVAMLNAESMKSADLRKAYADLESHEEMLAHKTIAHSLDTLTEAIRSKRAMLSAIQTLLGAHRAEAEAIKAGQYSGA